MKIPRSLAWRLGLTLGAALFGVSATFAQAPVPAAPAEERILQLEREVAALRAAIEALKNSDLEKPQPMPEPKVEPAPDKLAEVEAKIDVLAAEIEKLKIGEAAVVADLGGQARSEQGMGPAASKVYRAERGVSIGGYGEALYQNFDAETDDGAPSEETDELALERAVVYVGYKWNDRFLFNSEVEFEDAGEEVSVEFAGSSRRIAAGGSTHLPAPRRRSAPNERWTEPRRTQPLSRPAPPVVSVRSAWIARSTA